MQLTEPKPCKDLKTFIFMQNIVNYAKQRASVDN